MRLSLVGSTKQAQCWSIRSRQGYPRLCCAAYSLPIADSLLTRRNTSGSCHARKSVLAALVRRYAASSTHLQLAGRVGGSPETMLSSAERSAPTVVLFEGYPMEEETKRGPALTIFAVLLALLALSNMSKPLSGGRAGFVFLGTKTAGVANAILGPAFGIFLLVYAVGIWQQKRWAVPMAWAYAAYVPINLLLFTIKTPQRWQSPLFGLVYVAIALGVSWGSAILLTSRSTRLA
jgi:hypothetical protein